MKKKPNLSHIVIRLLAILGLYFISFFLIMEGNINGNMSSFGKVLAILLTIIITVLFLGIEAFKVRNINKKKANINIIILVFVVTIGFMVISLL